MRMAAVVFCFGLCSSAFLAAQIPPLAIVDQPLPSVETDLEFHGTLHATGGYPPYTWTVTKGDLPEGISFGPDGTFFGRTEKTGSFTVTVKVEDSHRPQNVVTKEIKIGSVSSLVIDWQEPPKAHDNRIDGSLQVTNGSTEGFDLTVIIVAVAGDGRATAIGYQHFPLNPGTKNLQIPFGNTMPFGSYTVHADAIAEIAKKNTILRRRLQTLSPISIVQGP